VALNAAAGVTPEEWTAAVKLGRKADAAKAFLFDKAPCKRKHQKDSSCSSLCVDTVQELPAAVATVAGGGTEPGTSAGTTAAATAAAAQVALVVQDDPAGAAQHSQLQEQQAQVHPPLPAEMQDLGARSCQLEPEEAGNAAVDQPESLTAAPAAAVNPQPELGDKAALMARAGGASAAKLNPRRNLRVVKEALAAVAAAVDGSQRASRSGQLGPEQQQQQQQHDRVPHRRLVRQQ
jgi:hypothetical protein